MRTRLMAVVAALVLGSVAVPVSAQPDAPAAPAPGGKATGVELVGHNPLFHRGMNAAPAIYGDHLYVGNRTDGSDVCVGGGTGCEHAHPGILVVDISDPAHPEVTGEIGPPHAGRIGITTRELRVWPEQKLLIVMSFRCSSVIHACPPGDDTTFPFDLSFFDLTDPVHPEFLSSYVPTSAAGLAVKPHEMFLWIDPANPDRALLWLSTPALSADRTIPNLMVVDISAVPGGGPVAEVAEGNWNDLYPGTDLPNYPVDPATGDCGPYDCNLFVHSMGVTADGATTHLAMEAGHFLVLDTTTVVEATSPPTGVIDLHDALLTDPVDRPVWLQEPADPAAVPENCARACPNGHSSVPVPGSSFAITTDEVYGTFTVPSHGCPWGWLRAIDVSDPTHPVIVDEHRIAQNEDDFCGSPADDPLTEQFTSYSSHNPTVLPNLALVTWHSGGFLVIDVSDPTNLSQVGSFSPKPLSRVATEDPALSLGPNKVVMWSYPIIRNGLIYVVDVRNGLYILRYTGPHAGEVKNIDFYEGNSNLGDAVRLFEGG